MSTQPTVLVTGASGLLGRDVVKAFERAGWKVVGAGLTRAKPPSIVKLDLLDGKAIETLLDDVRPDVIVHCAANRIPDSCTANPQAAAAVNSDATGVLASQAQQRKILLIYISTDYVFSGKPGEAPYKTTDPVDPTNIYGRTKADGEQALLKATGGLEDTHGSAGNIFGVALRVPLLYGHCEDDDPSKSAVHPIVDAVWKAQSLKDSDPKIKMDHYGIRYPTATEDVGRVCVAVADLYLQPASESKHAQLPRILHFSAEQNYTKYEMSKLFAEILGLPVDNLEPWDPTKDEESASTVRPYDSHLDTTALKDLGISIATCDFEAWWRREFRAYRH